MKTSEKIYTGIVLFLTGLMVIEIIFFEIMMVSRARIEKPEMVSFWHFISGILAVQAISLGVSAFWNLKKKKLSTVATVVQICSLLINTIGLPLGIWGIVLLRRSAERVRLKQPQFDGHSERNQSVPEGESNGPRTVQDLQQGI